MIGRWGEGRGGGSLILVNPTFRRKTERDLGSSGITAAKEAAHEPIPIIAWQRKLH